jgi:hypothetical protein
MLTYGTITLPQSLQSSVVGAVLSASSLGYLGASGAIAKGAMMMMTTAKVKVAAACVAVAIVLGTATTVTLTHVLADDTPQSWATSRPVAEAPENLPLEKLVSGKITRKATLSADQMILAYLPDWAFGRVDNIGVANNDAGVRVLLNWPAISDAELARRELKFYLALYSRKTTSNAPPGKLLALEILEAWTEATSWVKQPKVEAQPAASYDFTDDPGWKLFEITALVRAQGAAKRANRGVMLRFEQEDRAAANQDWSGYEFVSREGTGQWQEYRPVLLVVQAAEQPKP